MNWKLMLTHLMVIAILRLMEDGLMVNAAGVKDGLSSAPNDPTWRVAA